MGNPLRSQSNLMIAQLAVSMGGPQGISGSARKLYCAWTRGKGRKKLHRREMTLAAAQHRQMPLQEKGQFFFFAEPRPEGKKRVVS